MLLDMGLANEKPEWLPRMKIQLSRFRSSLFTQWTGPEFVALTVCHRVYSSLVFQPKEMYAYNKFKTIAPFHLEPTNKSLLLLSPSPHVLSALTLLNNSVAVALLTCEQTSLPHK